jgi:hypothetical protein
MPKLFLTFNLILLSISARAGNISYSCIEAENGRITASISLEAKKIKLVFSNNTEEEAALVGFDNSENAFVYKGLVTGEVFKLSQSIAQGGNIGQPGWLSTESLVFQCQPNRSDRQRQNPR